MRDCNSFRKLSLRYFVSRREFCETDFLSLGVGRHYIYKLTVGTYSVEISKAYDFMNLGDFTIFT